MNVQKGMVALRMEMTVFKVKALKLSWTFRDIFKGVTH